MNASDKDEPNTLHTKIKYTLLNGTNLFRIDPYSGVISASTNTLDREVLPIKLKYVCVCVLATIVHLCVVVVLWGDM